jgi:hypothetical protein
MIYEDFFRDTLYLQDYFLTSPRYFQFHDELPIDSIIVSPKIFNVTQQLILNSRVDIHVNKFSANFTDELELSSKIYNLFEESFEDDLSLVSTATQWEPEIYLFSDTLGVNDGLAVRKSRVIFTASDTLALIDNFSYLKIHNEIPVDPPPIDPPPGTDPQCYNTPNLGYIILEADAFRITLKAPEFDNKFDRKFGRENKRSRGNELILLNPSYWPKEKDNIYEFATLTDAEVGNLLSFVKATYGKMITMTDFKGRIHNGILITPELEITQTGYCAYSTSFTLQEYN